VKPVIVLYNPTHGLYRSGVLRDMIEMIHGIDGAGNLKIIERGKDPNVLSDVWDYRASSPTFNMQENMGTKADLIRINPDVIFVPTRYIDKLPDYKEDLNAVIKDPELQAVTAIKKGHVYPIHEMHIMSYSSWMYFGMQQMSRWLYGDWSYDNFVKYQSVPAN
jgi:ABC transporter, substrate-binding protein